MRISLIITLVSALAACGDDVVVPTWDPVDVQALQERLDSPSGSVNSLVISKDLIESLASNAESLAALMESLDELRTTSPPLDDPPAGGSGTIAFVEVACPGSNLDAPVTDFSSGWARLDVPGLDIAQALRGAYAFEGSLLLSFVDCRRGEIVFDGECPLFVALNGTLAFSARLTVTEDESPEPRTLSADGLFTEGELSFILGDPDGITVTVSVDDTTELRLSGSDGRLICGAEAASCEPN